MKKFMKSFSVLLALFLALPLYAFTAADIESGYASNAHAEPRMAITNGTVFTLPANMPEAKYPGLTGGMFIAPIAAPVEGSIPVSSRAELAAINEYGNYHLIADIDLSGADWVPLASSIRPFNGVLDGQGYVIKNLTVTGSVDYAGLFAEVGFNGVVKNVGLVGTDIEVTGGDIKCAGGIVGRSSGSISNCYNTGTVSATTSYSSSLSYVGGIVGRYGNSSNCYNTGAVSASAFYSYAGGIVGSSGDSSKNLFKVHQKSSRIPREKGESKCGKHTQAT